MKNVNIKEVDKQKKWNGKKSIKYRRYYTNQKHINIFLKWEKISHYKHTIFGMNKKIHIYLTTNFYERLMEKAENFWIN